MDAALKGYTQSLVRHVRGRLGAPRPPDVEATARLALLDWLGVSLAGAREPLALMLKAEAVDQGASPQACIIGHRERSSPQLAAMVNAASADALDFSDGNFAMRGHTTPAVVASALALSEARGASVGQLLDAIVTGIETECRIGLLLNPPRIRKGFHPTGSLATFGATAAAAALWGLNDAQWAMALGLAATQAAGVLASGGTMAKPLHSGKAAFNGILSASLARRGFESNPQALESADGFLETHATTEYPKDVIAFDDRYLVMGTIFKAHAACQLTHSTIKNAERLRDEHRLSPDEVARIELNVPPFYLTVCNIQTPTTALQAKFSLRAVAAMVLLGEDTRDIEAYRPERVQRDAMRRLIDRIDVVAKDELSGGLSTATCTTTSGRIITLSSDTYRPIEDMAEKHRVVVDKFASLTRGILGDHVARTLVDKVMGMPHDASVQALVDLATPGMTP